MNLDQQHENNEVDYDYYSIWQSFIQSEEGHNFLNDLVEEEMKSDFGNEQLSKRLRTTRSSSYTRGTDYSLTKWGKMIKHPDVNNVRSKIGRLFRRRFRVPFPLFEVIVKMCDDNNIFELKNQYQPIIPTRICAKRCRMSIRHFEVKMAYIKERHSFSSKVNC